MATYTCKWYGFQSSIIGGLTSSICDRSPHKKHESMNATEKLSEYVCKYCGFKGSHPAGVASGTCNKSPHPNKAHELLG